MKRMWLHLSMVLVASTYLRGQELAPRSALHQVVGPVRNAGVFHVGLGTWTRRVDAMSVSSWDVVYANTCPNGYYSGLYLNEYIGDEGRLPGPNGPVFCDTSRLSTNAGCECSYVLSAFQIGYCSGFVHDVSLRIGFQSTYIACSVPATQHSFMLTGLPGSATNPQLCWQVTIDLEAASQTFTLNADGASCAWGTNDLATNHLFGWTIENLTSVTVGGPDFVGALIAGQGGPSAPVPTCSMVDGTRWDTLTCPGQAGGPDKWPNNMTEDGWGMDTQDRFRDDTTTGGPIHPPSGPGCFYFGSNPNGSYYLRLFSKANCPPPPASNVCVSGVSGVIACPCNNPQLPPLSTRGCNNSANTGGAILSSSGAPSLTMDTLQFTSTGETPNVSSILLQGRLPLNAHGIPFGQGVRCITTAIVRLYLHNAVAGVVTFPQSADLTVHAQSAAKGDVISGPSTRLYAVYYRDPTVLGTCSPSETFNTSQTQSLVWVP
jgi:hypothetical protein